MLTFPNINPVAIALGPIQIHWYGLMYMLGFFSAWLLANWRVKKYQLAWTSEQIGDLIFALAVGVIAGGRLGYMLFYNTQELIDKPWVLFKLWQGGMSFHGGLIGVILAISYVAYRSKRSFLSVADFVAPLVPLGLAAGRAGNFINGELWGRVSDAPWAMIFPNAGPWPRHPSQLYELVLEGLVLFVVVWIYAAKSRPPGRITGVFLVGYALARITIELFREPDSQLGFIAFDWLTMGQLLSIPMVLVGLFLWWRR